MKKKESGRVCNLEIDNFFKILYFTSISAQKYSQRVQQMGSMHVSEIDLLN